MSQPPQSQRTRNPVVLIHGIDDTDAIFGVMSSELQRQGWSVYSLNLSPPCGKIGLDRLAQQVQAFIELTFDDNQPIDLVGFSMGGIIARYYVQRLGGLNRVQRFITISSPHQGTWTGYLRSNEGCTQMRPDSAFLQDLNQDVHRLNQIHFTSVWTPLDLMIVPATSSVLPVGQHIPVWVAGHAWMVADPQSLQAVTQALSAPLKKRTSDASGFRPSSRLA